MKEKPEDKPELYGDVGRKGIAAGFVSKAEMQSDANRHEMGHGRSLSQNLSAAGMHGQNGSMNGAHSQDSREMYTNNNRHELENTEVSATLNQPWSSHNWEKY